MISLDQSRGSIELLRFFTPFGVPVRVCNLVPIGGDAWFTGKSLDGDINIVVERKRIGDFIDSMKSNRLKGFQLPLMQKNYDLIYIIVEGIYRPGDNGQLEEARNGGWVPLNVMYRQIDNFMTSLGRYCDGIKRSATPDETVHQIVDLYRFYEHAPRQRAAIYSPEPTACRPGGKVRSRAAKTRWVEKFAYLLPGVDSKVYAVADQFKSIRAAVNAPVSEWRKVPGIGKIGAENIQKALDAEGSDL